MSIIFSLFKTIIFNIFTANSVQSSIFIIYIINTHICFSFTLYACLYYIFYLSSCNLYFFFQSGFSFSYLVIGLFYNLLFGCSLPLISYLFQLCRILALENLFAVSKLKSWFGCSGIFSFGFLSTLNILVIC